MAQTPRLDLRQSATLTMTPQLRQAIGLLALSNRELEAVVAAEIDRNPLLELAPPDPDAPQPPHWTEALPAPPRDRPPSAGRPPSRNAAPAGAAASDLDALPARDSTLHDHLFAQAGATLEGEELHIARALIEAIDANGYLADPLDEVAEMADCSLSDAEKILAQVQTFDPTGVGARSLAECIALQAREVDRYDPAMAALIDNLDLLARGEMARLETICGVDAEDLADMVRELRGYDPRPGLRISGETAQAIIPDVFVRRTPEGWAVELNGDTLPRLLVNRRYEAELAAQGAHDRQSRDWLAEQAAGAHWLVKALDRRAQTILRVTRELLRQQEVFFRDPDGQLRPLTLQPVAAAVDLHPSTVSRAIAHKYLACDRGTFALRSFFTSGVAATNPDAPPASAGAVQAAIRALVAAEGDAILSDDQLVDLLAERGFRLARRTVAKYREAIGIGSSVWRRRARAMKGHGA